MAKFLRFNARGYVISKFFFIHFTISGVKKIVRYTVRYVEGRLYRGSTVKYLYTVP